MKRPCVYILTNKPNGVLYVGVTSDLSRRMCEHDQGLVDGFSKRYGLRSLVYHNFFATMPEAIAHEKRLKSWQRAWKIRLIHSTNPEWKNLFNAEAGEILPGSAEAFLTGH